MYIFLGGVERMVVEFIRNDKINIVVVVVCEVKNV